MRRDQAEFDASETNCIDLPGRASDFRRKSQRFHAAPGESHFEPLPATIPNTHATRPANLQIMVVDSPLSKNPPQDKNERHSKMHAPIANKDSARRSATSTPKVHLRRAMFVCKNKPTVPFCSEPQLRITPHSRSETNVLWKFGSIDSRAGQGRARDRHGFRSSMHRPRAALARCQPIALRACS
jgi:hypothetical protein